MQYQKEVVRARIIASALTEFEKHGFLDAQMRNIARGAGIATGNLYRYFAGKDDLFDAIVKSVYQSIDALITDQHAHIHHNQGNVKLVVKDIVAKIMLVFTQHGRELLIAADQSRGSKHEDFWTVLSGMVFQRIRQEMQKSADDTDDLLINLVASGFLQGMFTILRNIKEPRRAEELINRMLIFYFDDLSNRLRSY
ncbi:MAG: TetR/AcrR family transcriptional regulator [Peptococcaceae bacterium]|nr:TetR/AcrR family transcriptional regulator [Peptococcaceae bacterium]